MYDAFFGFKERPFQLVPNPAYLFLSQCHEEALAHLIYAVSHGDGFVEITGEVGTGKTTLCRVFIEQLDEKTEAAYIFNPKLDALELLKAINDEFGIDPGGDTIKDLIDVLNTYLMAKKAEGKTVVLLIDEAQNLSKEVLEQLRLLSNLETNTGKLLQIILVGQPELGEMLSSYELRQLGQRITLSCRLAPLSLRETKQYIQHRLHIASGRPGAVFSRAAYRVIYRFSGGIPRLINIACDRALLAAFGHGRLKISGSVAREAVRELTRASVGKTGPGSGRSISWQLLSAAAVVFLILLLFFYPHYLARNSSPLPEGGKPRSEDPATRLPAPTPPSDPVRAQEPTVENESPPPVPGGPAAETAPLSSTASEAVPETAQVVVVRSEAEKSAEAGTTPVGFGQFLANLAAGSLRLEAIEAAMVPWGAAPSLPDPGEQVDDQTFFKQAAKRNGFQVRRFQANLHLLTNINLPAVVQFNRPDASRPVYLTLVGIKGEDAFLRNEKDGVTYKATPAELESSWAGVAYVPWKDFLQIADTIPVNAANDSVVALKKMLRSIGFPDLDEMPVYDEPTREAIVAIQKKYGINVDGIVGPSTLIVLYNEVETLPIPHLTEE